MLLWFGIFCSGSVGKMTAESESQNDLSTGVSDIDSIRFFGQNREFPGLFGDYFGSSFGHYFHFWIFYANLYKIFKILFDNRTSNILFIFEINEIIFPNENAFENGISQILYYLSGAFHS